MLLVSLLSQMRVRKVKFLFLAMENFWLYEYHKSKYPWLAREVFSTIRLIEEKKS